MRPEGDTAKLKFEVTLRFIFTEQRKMDIVVCARGFQMVFKFRCYE
jgi:hypothetical protein